MPSLSPAPPFCVFFFHATAPTAIYTLSLHDALPISNGAGPAPPFARRRRAPSAENPLAVEREGHDRRDEQHRHDRRAAARSEEHTSELQSHVNLVCRLLLEKKKKTNQTSTKRHS